MENLQNMNQAEIDDLNRIYQLEDWELEDKVLQINLKREEEREWKAWEQRQKIAKLMRISGFVLLAVVLVFIAAALYEGNRAFVALVIAAIAAGMLITTKPGGRPYSVE